ncbi:MAG: hypothetical protein DHS20C15_10260 [Planctomycetota bacterium]|nr:MAG: hypothetical protein DHS20C15_10260 [Planctomycetota bacterium]
MKSSSVGITVVLIAGGVLAALCAVVLLLQWPDEPGRAEQVTPLKLTPLQRSGGEASLPRLPTARQPARKKEGPQRVTPPPRPRAGPDSIVGRVVDGATDKVVPDFQVQIFPARADLDPMSRFGEVAPEAFHHREGVFRLPQKPGKYDVVVLAPGFEPSVIREWLVPAADGRPVRVPLDRGPGISGTVIDAYNGQPLVGVPVYLHIVRLDDPESVVTQRRRAITQHDGRYSFSPLPSGQYSLSLLEPTNRTDFAGGVWVGKGTTLRDLYLLPRHTVVFRVHEIDGRPAPGARVTLQGNGTSQSVVANDAGQLVMEHLLDGTYSVDVLHEGFESISEELFLEGGAGQHLSHLYLRAFAD